MSKLLLVPHKVQGQNVEFFLTVQFLPCSKSTKTIVERNGCPKSRSFSPFVRNLKNTLTQKKKKKQNKRSQGIKNGLNQLKIRHTSQVTHDEQRIPGTYNGTRNEPHDDG